MTWRLRMIAGCGPASAWTAAGFTVVGGVVWLGDTALCCGSADHPRWLVERSGAAGRGVASVPDIPDTDVLQRPASPIVHANHAVSIDHVVIATADLDGTIDDFVAAGIDCRRIRHVPNSSVRQAFFRLGPTVLEVVGGMAASPPNPAIWGLAIDVDDLDSVLVEPPVQLGRIRPAVQQGRRIAPLRGAFSLQVALMDHRAATAVVH